MLGVVNVAVLAILLQEDAGNHAVNLISAVLLVLSVILMGFLSYFEHVRSLRTSLLLSAYLLVSLALGVVRTRTAWLAFGNQLRTILLIVDVGLTAILAILEAIPKTKWKDGTAEDTSPEETSGLYTLAFFSWLIPLIRLGNRKIISTEDLYPLDSRLAADTLARQFQKIWQRPQKKPGNRSLLLALLQSLAWPICEPIPSRTAMVGFAFCQPFFIRALINYMEASSSSHARTSPSNLVLACILTYGGIAFSNSYFHYLNQRVSAKVRGVLVSAIFQKTTELSATSVDTSVLTFMSTDIERIQRGFQPLHDLWALPLQIALAAWLLYLQLGSAFAAPIAVVFLCALGSVGVSGFIRARVLRWTRCSEVRVKLTNAVVAGMKSVKISGVAGPTGALLQRFRETELRAAVSLRIMALVAITNAFLPTYISPVVTFFAAGRRLGMAEVFASLSYLMLITGPLNQLFQKIPGILSGVASLKRIQDFLEKDVSADYRQFETSEEPEPGAESAAISLENMKVGWTEGKWQLSDLNLTIPKSRLTIVTGPVACGKSTLCRALLGEASFTEGTLRIHSPQPRAPRIAYCDQTAFLVNGSVRSNIVGFGAFDAPRYDEVLDAVLLRADLRALPRGDATEVGSGGVTLSGGQRQRVALARALYLGADLCVLDDVTVGLDGPTADEVVQRLFRPGDGLLRQRRATVVWCTHNVQFLPLAQHIIALGADGRVLHQGPPEEVLRDRQVTLALEHEEGAAEPEGEKKHDDVPGDAKPALTNKDASRALNGMDVYRHYFSSFSLTLKLTSACTGVAFGFFANFSYVGLKFWADNSFDIPGPQSRINNFYLSILAASSVLTIITMIFFIATVMIGMATVSGSILHLRAVQALMGSPLSFLTRTDQGVIVNYFSQDMNLLDMALPNSLLNMFALSALTLGQAVVLIVGTPLLAWAYPFLVLLLYFLTRYYLRASRQLRLLELENKSPLYAQFSDAVRGLASLRAFGWLADLTLQHHRLLDDSQRPLYLLQIMGIWLGLVLRLIVAALAIAATVLAAVPAGSLGDGAGFLGPAFIALMEMGDLLNAVVQCWVEFEMSLGAVKRLRDFGETAGSEDRVGEDLRPGEQWPESGEIVLQEVDASYAEEQKKYTDLEEDEEEPTHLALRGVSMRIAAGEKVAVVGRTGSGKSSLILLLLRLLDPTPGTPADAVTIDGLPLGRLHRATLRRRVVAMPQDMVFLAAGETFEAALDPDACATHDERREALARVGLLDAIEEAGGLRAEVGKDSLSQGQKQLFSLAVAVLRARFREREGGARGGVLLLDEVTSNVDRETEKTIMSVIGEVFREYTVVAVTHSLESVGGFDKVFVMGDGRILKEGTPQSLIKEEESTS